MTPNDRALIQEQQFEKTFGWVARGAVGWGFSLQVSSYELKEQIGPCGCEGGGMTEELCPNCIVEMPLANSSPLEHCLHLCKTLENPNFRKRVKW